MEIEETSDEDEVLNSKQDAGTATDDQQKQKTEKAKPEEEPQGETAGKQENKKAEKQATEEETAEERTDGGEMPQETETGEKGKNVQDFQQQAGNGEGSEETAGLCML